MSQLSDVSDADFATEVLASDIPVLVDFWAKWCAPCKAIVPHLDTIATENAGKLKVVKLDIQSNMKTASQFKVSGLPVFVVIKGGREVARQQGVGGGLHGLRKLVERHV